MPANAVNCIKGEIHNVIASLRLGGASSVGLLQDFKALHDSLCAVSSRTAITDIDTLSYFEPFLALLQSEQTSGVVTHVALSAINKFILYGFLAPSAVQTAQVLNRTAAAASLVRFERIDRSIDEQVYLQICTTLLHCIICPAGKLLNDSAVWLCVKTCYDISISDSLSPIVCRFAEDVLMQMVLCVFSHVSSMAGEEAGDVGSLKLRDRNLPLPTSLDGDHTPYNAQCVLYICRWLFSLVDPQQSEENHRVYGLGLVNVALETSGQMIGLIPPIVEMIGHDLCKYLLQNSQSTTVPILSLTLRVIFNLFNSSVKGNLKVQLEVFFNTIHLRIPAVGNENGSASTGSAADDEQVPYEKKELILESLVEFCAEPELMVDLYCNYDLDLASSNLFEKLTAFLAANMFSDTGRFNSLHRLCLEALLAVVESVEQMFCHPENTSYTLLQSNDSLDAGNDDVAKAKAEKKKIAQAAEQWNKNKKKSLSTLASMGMITSADDPVAIAKFFRNTPGLDLDSLGEYFGRISTKFNQSVFAEFVKTFNFEGLGLDMALRTFLESFKLPGEAQQVSTILEAFAARYYEHNAQSAANADTIFILSFSIIMLNTDLHNDGVKNKMTLEQFITNNRGIDDGKSLPKEFLESIYNEILHNEIKMTPDTDTLDAEEMDDKQWEQLLRSGSNSQISSGTATLAVGRDMFALICTKVVSAMCMSLDTTSPIHNERMVHKVLTAFEHVVHIAAFFKLPDILNNAVTSLCKSLHRQIELLAGLIERAGPAAAFRDSTSKKTLQIVQALFKIVHSKYSILQDAWLNIIECVVLLNRGPLNLLPTDLTDVDDFYDASGKPLPSSVSQLAAAQYQRAGHSEEGLSFLSLFYPPEEEEIEQQRAADQEAEKAMRAVVATCNISGIFVASRTLSAETLPHLVNALLKCTGSYTADGGGHSSSSNGANGKVFSEELLSQIYCLEWLTNVCRHNQFRMDVLWPLVCNFFQSGLAAGASGTAGSAAGKHRLFLERIVVSILRLCCYFEESHIVSSPRGPRSPVDTLFATLRPICATVVPTSPQNGNGQQQQQPPPPPLNVLPEGVVLALGSRVTAGLLMLLRSNGSMLREPASWDMVFDICERYVGQLTSQQCALESLHYVITNHHELYVGPGPRFMKVLLNVAGTASKASPTDRSHTLVDSLVHMHETLASTLPRPHADTAAGVAAHANVSTVFLPEAEWAERWIQTLVWIATQCLDPRPDAHNYAASNLHKALFSSTVPTPPVEVLCRTFSDVLYRLLPEIVNHSRPVDDMRVKLFNLLSQFFLHNIATLRASAQLDEFLAGYLSFIRQYMSGNHDTTVLDSICDILRNTMMVMSVEGLLASVPVWSEATKLLEQFCPDLKHSLSGGSPFAPRELAAEMQAAAAIAAQSQSLQQQQVRQEQLQHQVAAGSPMSPSRTFSRDELQGMKVSALSKLAAKQGVHEDAIDDAMEADRPKDALIELLVQTLPMATESQPVAEATSEGVDGATEAPQPGELPPPPPSSAAQLPIAPDQQQPQPEPQPAEPMPPPPMPPSQPADPMPPPAMPPPAMPPSQPADPMPPPAMPPSQPAEPMPPLAGIDEVATATRPTAGGRSPVGPPSETVSGGEPPPQQLSSAMHPPSDTEPSDPAPTASIVPAQSSAQDEQPPLPPPAISTTSAVGGNITDEASPPPAEARPDERWAAQPVHVAAVAVEAFDVQFAPTSPTNGDDQPVAVAAVATVEPNRQVEVEVALEANSDVVEEDDGPVYPTDWGGLCNALCSEFPTASRTDVIGVMGRNDNDGKRAAEELRRMLAKGEIDAEGPPIDDPDYAASHGL